MSNDLFEDHRNLLEAAEAFVVMLKQEPRPTISELNRARMKMSTLIRRQRAAEEELIFGPLARGGGLGKMPHLEPFVQELMREKVRYSDHVRQWTPQAIEQNWNGYVTAVEGLLDGLRRVMKDEQSSVYRVVRGLSPAFAESRAARH
ncbi:MAG TPA: hypothetical protein VFF89_11830 [Sphingobium sp.]|nr:hypothetical protein [Sphingobium sp.]